jgi:hypothetical protein
VKKLPIIILLSAVTLSSGGCLLGRDPEHTEHVVVEHRERERVVVVERQPPPPVVVERRVVVVQQAPPPVVYREVYVEGRPAPSIRIEVIPTRPRQESVWVQGRWEHEHGGHDEHGHDRGDHWGWHGGYWH